MVLTLCRSVMAMKQSCLLGAAGRCGPMMHTMQMLAEILTLPVEEDALACELLSCGAVIRCPVPSLELSAGVWALVCLSLVHLSLPVALKSGGYQGGCSTILVCVRVCSVPSCQQVTAGSMGRRCMPDPQSSIFSIVSTHCNLHCVESCAVLGSL